MGVKLKNYKKEMNHSYALGVFPTLELITLRPNQIIQIMVSSRGDRNIGVEKIKSFCRAQKIPLEINDGWLNKVSSSENCYAAGIFNKYNSQIEKDQNQIVLVNPSDAGNLGTILRTMLSFSINNLAIISPAVDIFNPKVIRASMGALFRINFEYFDNFNQYQKSVSTNLYPFMTDGSYNLTEIKLEKPYSLIFGNEGEGLDANFQNIGKSVKINQEKTTDSLNLAVAAGIALYKAYSN